MNPHEGSHEEGVKLRRVDLNPLVAMLEKYNRQFSPGALLAEQILSGMRFEEEEEREERPARQQINKLSSQEIKSSFWEVLGKTGLDIEPVEGGAAIFSPQGEIPTSRMRINVKEGEKFVQYLHALEGVPTTASQIEGLAAIAKSLTLQLETVYDLSGRDERMLELFGKLDAIIQGYNHLDPKGNIGLRDSVKKLADYLVIARSGYLREYFLAVKTVQKIQQNQKAAEFCSKMIDNLKRSIEYALQDLPRQSEYFGEEDVASKTATLRESLQILSR
jgi:hypothetical protein